MEKRHLPLRAYILTWVALLLLTELTVTLGLSFAPLGASDIVFAHGIAALKASLVAVFFMHLYEQRGISRLVLVVSGTDVALLVSLLGADVVMRDNAGAWPPIKEASVRRTAISAKTTRSPRSCRLAG